MSINDCTIGVDVTTTGVDVTVVIAVGDNIFVPIVVVKEDGLNSSVKSPGRWPWRCPVK
ncbi:unnamed protein product [Schistosoma mattheei]|uniref:Uncharacterized protein n=1 Tax=Schistosoma mattheei TaxID=31246 RepID=A0A3P8FSX1_9TREM|nr:unnamed protein product [Schistosoma mattheei]